MRQGIPAAGGGVPQEPVQHEDMAAVQGMAGGGLEEVQDTFTNIGANGLPTTTEDRLHHSWRTETLQKFWEVGES